MQALADRLDARLCASSQVIQTLPRGIVVTGIGKSGHIARKICSHPRQYRHPHLFVTSAEASHGDLGMITPDDVMIHPNSAANIVSSCASC